MSGPAASIGVFSMTWEEPPPRSMKISRWGEAGFNRLRVGIAVGTLP